MTISLDGVPPLPDGLVFRLRKEYGVWSVEAVRPVTRNRLFRGPKTVYVEVDSHPVADTMTNGVEGAVRSAAMTVYRRRAADARLRAISKEMPA